MDPEQILERASAANRARRHERAVELCNVAQNRSTTPHLVARACLGRAEAHVALGAWSRAEVDCRAALQSEPASAARLLLARCLLELERVADAESVLAEALADERAPPNAWQLAARVFAALDRRAEALVAARRAYALEPSLEHVKTLVRALAAAGEHDEAIALGERAGERDAELLVALGMSFYSSDRSEEAIATLERALELAPDHADAHCGLAWVLLRLGRHASGFRHHEYRLKGAGVQRRFGIPPWQGEPLTGKSLIICAEQGYGDTLQFARFVPELVRAAVRTRLHVPPALVRLFESNPALGPVDGHLPEFGAADRQALLMSLPELSKVGDDVSGGRLPCVFPEAERIARFRSRLPPGPKVGLAFQGNPRYGGEPWRSMPFARFAPLFERFGPNVRFLSLQKHVGREQLAASGLGGRVLDLGDEIDLGGHAFLDSLAILTLLDAFVTTDSALAHLAGSAGIEAWILLSHAADWRWGTAPDSTPWYPSLRLFRQERAGDWDGVIERVGQELAGRLARRAG